MTAPYRFTRASQRPLALARALTESPVINMEQRQVRLPPNMLGGCVPVVLDQVSDWWDSVGPNKWPDDRLEPMGRLPWPKVWCEWIESRAEYLNARQGALLTELSLNALDQLAHVDPAIHQGVREFAKLGAVGAVSAMVYGQVEESPIVMGFPPLLLPYDADNQPIVVKGYHRYLCAHSDPVVGEMIYTTIGVWRLFTALLQVHGTHTVDTPIPRNVRRQAARLKDGPPPWVCYKTLSVHLTPEKDDEPVTRGRLAGPPPGVPLHLVRGHIADYRVGKGLFGRIKGLVWRPAHRRGMARLGAIAKTYEAVVDE